MSLLAWRSGLLKVLITVLGTALVGACAGLPYGVPHALAGAVSLAGLVLVMAALMVPALYISLALAGAAPPANQVASDALDGLYRMGILCLGLSPALAFLGTTSTSPDDAGVYATVALATGVCLGMERLYSSVTRDAQPTLMVGSLYAAWALVGMVIGFRLWGLS